MKKSVKIHLFNRELLLSERTANDIIFTDNFNSKAADRTNADFWTYSLMISHSLQINIQQLRWYQVVHRLIYKIILDPQYLRRKLSRSELLDLVFKIYNIELQATREIEDSNKILIKKMNRDGENS